MGLELAKLSKEQEGGWGPWNFQGTFWNLEFQGMNFLKKIFSRISNSKLHLWDWDHALTHSITFRGCPFCSQY